MRKRLLIWWTGGWVLAGGMMPTGCGPEDDPATQLAAQAQATTDPGGVVLEPNVIRARVSFTNQNPEILGLFESDPRRFARVVATSTRPTGFTASSPFLTPSSLLGYDVDLQVEAAAGGPTGITYRITPQWFATGIDFYPFYDFQPVSALVQPRELQPDPTPVDIQECVGVLRFQWGTDETCQTPVEVTNARFNGRYMSIGFPRASSYHAYVRGGTSGTGTLQYAGPDGFNRERRISFSAVCDEVIRVCTAVPATTERGSVNGPWDVAGEELLRERFIPVFNGPNSAGSSFATTQLRAPVTEPARWWTVPNLVPGDYGMYGRGGLRRGREFTWFRTDSLPVTVAAGQVTSVTRLVDGQLRYPFDFHPAYFQGSVRLADPYVVSSPGARSSLEALFFEADIDTNRDGAPDFYTFFDRPASDTRFSTVLVARPPVSGLAFSYTAFPGRFEAAAGEFASSYEQVLPSAFDLPFTWRQPSLRLGFWAEGSSSTSLFVTRPAEYDPARFRYGYLDLTQRRSGAVVNAQLAPGQTQRLDHAYCFNEVQLEYSSTGAPFYNPTAGISGSFRGTDWRGESADYAVSGRAWGIPAALGIPQSEAITYATSRGSVSFALPQGSYTLTPGATLVSAAGQVNDATFQPLTFTVGCGQRLKLVPPLAVNITPQPTCTREPGTTVSGTVQSSPAEVDRIWYTVNDGPEVTLCTDCGINPRFSFAVQLHACENTVKVYAYTAGLAEPAASFQQLLWDDPTDGPSCADASCVNRPPVARCKSVTVPADSACAGWGSIDDGSFDPEDGAVRCTQTPDGPFGLGRTRVTLRCSDSRGATASCEAAVTVADQTPPVLSCPPGQTLECSAGGAQASFLPTASDRCSALGPVSCTPASGATFPVGTSLVSCSVSDAAGNRSSCSFGVMVTDTAPPAVSVGEPLVLWPPDHGLRRVSLADCGLEVRDACSGEVASAAVRARVLCVSADEAAAARGAGQTAEDIVLVDTGTVALRAERAGGGDGRVYRIRFEVEDAAGNRTPGECVVGVPHDQRGAAAVDSGMKYQVCRR